MRSKPFIFNLLSTALLLVALAFPLQIFWLYDYSWSTAVLAFGHLTWMNWLVIFLCIAGSALSYYAQKELKWALRFLTLLVFFNNFIVYRYGENFGLHETALSFALFSLVNIVFLLKSSSLILRKQELRWWLTPARHKVQTSVYVGPWTGEGFSSESFDISESGAFIVENHQAKWLNNDLQPGKKICLRLNVGHLETLRVEAEVARQSEGGDTHPPGIGVRFLNMNFQEKRILRRFLQRSLAC